MDSSAAKSTETNFHLDGDQSGSNSDYDYDKYLTIAAEQNSREMAKVKQKYKSPFQSIFYIHVSRQLKFKKPYFIKIIVRIIEMDIGYRRILKDTYSWNCLIALIMYLIQIYVVCHG